MSNVDHPYHYNQFDIEVIKLARHLTFDAGNFLKYVMRAPYKGEMLEDLQKALWYARDFTNHLKSKNIYYVQLKRYEKLSYRARYFIVTIRTQLDIPESQNFAKLFELIFDNSIANKKDFAQRLVPTENYMRQKLNEVIDCITAGLIKYKNENQGAGR